MDLDLKQKTIMITGGTGSFGRKCTETLLRIGPPQKLIIFSRDELKQYEMRQQFPDPCLRFFIGDVRDRDRLYRAMYFFPYSDPASRCSRGTRNSSDSG